MCLSLTALMGLCAELLIKTRATPRSKECRVPEWLGPRTVGVSLEPALLLFFTLRSLSFPAFFHFVGSGNYFFPSFLTSGASLLPLICCCSARLFNHFSKMCLFTMPRFCAAVGAGGAQAKDAVVCLWWRMKVSEKSGELTDKARRKLVFLSHSRRAWNCKRNADFPCRSLQCQKSY